MFVVTAWTLGIYGSPFPLVKENKNKLNKLEEKNIPMVSNNYEIQKIPNYEEKVVKVIKITIVQLKKWNMIVIYKSQNYVIPHNYEEKVKTLR